MENSVDNIKSKFDFLYKAIDDTQNTIRFSDTKALAVIGFWTLIINTVISTRADWLALIDKLDNFNKSIFVIFALLIIGCFLRSIWLAYLTLVPMISPKSQVSYDGVETKDIFFLHQTTPNLKGKYLYNNYEDLKLTSKVSNYLEEINGSSENDLVCELVSELHKVSLIRGYKVQRVNFAIKSIIYFLIILLVGGLYILLSHLFSELSLSPYFNLELNIKLFIVLYIAHKIADYLLQTDFQAINKAKSWRALIIHCLVYTITLSIMAYIFAGYFDWRAIFIIFVSHIIIDRKLFLNWWAVNIKKMSNIENESSKNVFLELDQSFHYIVIFIICLI